jgi:hypothetical protein
MLPDACRWEAAGILPTHHALFDMWIGGSSAYTPNIALLVPGGRDQDQVCEAGAGKEAQGADPHITQLQEGDCGIPTLRNFPFVDEIIPPNIGVRYTTGRPYRDGPRPLRPSLRSPRDQCGRLHRGVCGTTGEI